MRILIANDDGINAEGIRCLWEELAKIADEVIVVAPDSERSAMSQALTLQVPLRATKHKVNIKNVKAWRINGTPADCTKIAMEQLLTEKPDFIVTGINHGPNLASDILYSGTVGAAIEGVIYGVPAIAMSLVNWGTDADNHFISAARFAGKLVQRLAKEKLDERFLLNVNVPNLPEENIGEVVITKMGHIKYRNIFQKRVDPRGKNYYWLSGDLCRDVDNDKDTDFVTVTAGKISVMPMQIDFTNYAMRDKLAKILS